MGLADQNRLKQQFTMEAPVLLDKDLATKKYVDDKVAGLMWDPVYTATTENLAVTATATTLTSDPIAAFPDIDGVPGVVGMRILVKDQTDRSQNGIYEITDLGDGATAPWVLTRTIDANDSTDFKPNKKVFVTPGGSENGDTSFVLLTVTEVEVGVTPLDFEAVIDTNARIETVEFDSDDQVTSYTITHTLNTTDIILQAKQIDVTPAARVEFGWFVVDSTTVRITCNPALPLGEKYRVTLAGAPD